MSFEKLELTPSILQVLAKEGYARPTPVQNQAIPVVLAGRDLLACAQTGTGKTAAFALPILQLLSEGLRNGARKAIRALILAPTRELALQIGDSFSVYGRNLALRHAVVYGGVGYGAQKDKLARGVDVLIATPGRLNDLHEQGVLSLDGVEIFTLDEADRMLDMGFIRDVRRIADMLPRVRQTLLFSATMPEEIRKLADSLLSNPARIHVAPQAATADNIEQSVYYVPREMKLGLLKHLLSEHAVERALVFTRTKHGADKLAKKLYQFGISAEALHGNKSQNARERSLAKFREGRARVLVATDIASRGIDIDEISHVFNYELPEIPETYVHRIGRTARAGASGVSFTFCDPVAERALLSDIERHLKNRIRIIETPADSLLLSLGTAQPQLDNGGRGTEENRPRPHHSRGRGTPHRKGGRQDNRVPGGFSGSAPGHRSRFSGTSRRRKSAGRFQ